MRKDLNTSDLRRKISLYFDNELDNQDSASLLNRVEVDPKCSSLFEKEKDFRNYIKSNLRRSSVSSNLIQNIKNNISTL